MDQATLQHCFEGQRAAFRSKMPGYAERLEALRSLESALLKHKGQIVAAWNYPLFLSCAPLANALAARDHVMLKPSEFAPRTAESLRSIVAELFSPDYVTVVLGEAETGSEFSRLPFDHLLYTGSGRVGKLVLRAPGSCRPVPASPASGFRLRR